MRLERGVDHARRDRRLMELSCAERGKRVLEAKGILLGWSRGRAVMLRRELKRAWKAFRAAERFW